MVLARDGQSWAHICMETKQKAMLSPRDRINLAMILLVNPHFLAYQQQIMRRIINDDLFTLHLQFGHTLARKV